MKNQRRIHLQLNILLWIKKTQKIKKQDKKKFLIFPPENRIKNLNILCNKLLKFLKTNGK